MFTLAIEENRTRRTMRQLGAVILGFVVVAAAVTRPAAAQCGCGATISTTAMGNGEMTLIIQVQAGGIEGGTLLTVPEITHALDCHNDGAFEDCVDARGTIAYLGDATLGTNCVAFNDVGQIVPVAVSSNNPTGGTQPNVLTLAFDPPAMLPSFSACEIFLDVSMTGPAAMDATPDLVEAESHLVGSCDNGSQAAAEVKLAIPVSGAETASCCAEISEALLTPPDVHDAYYPGSVVTVNLQVGAAMITAGMLLDITQVSHALDCHGVGLLEECVDEGARIDYLGDATLTTDCVSFAGGGPPQAVAVASDNPDGGALPNVLNLTFSPAAQLPAFSYCNVTFDVMVAESPPSGDSTPAVIERVSMLEGICDNGVPASARNTGCIRVASCPDQNGDGRRDDGCSWYAVEDGDCIAVPRLSQADLGGHNGTCAPDGATDGHDRFHALNCFSNTDTMGQEGYPCEFSAPSALNVDAGAAQSCALDGVCDGNDAFHALNAFENRWFDGSAGYLCDCGGPAPARAPGTAGKARPVTSLVLYGPATATPGDVVELEVHADGDLQALRGYQLHVAASTNRTAALAVHDIFVDSARRNWAFAGVRGIWTAFNQQAGQVLVGMDASDGAPIRSGSYLATFAFRVPENAKRLEVSLRYSDGAAQPSERTFMFGRAAGLIEVATITPAVIKVGAPGQLLSARRR